MGGELQSLDCGQVREDRLGQLLDREIALDGQHRGLDAVGAFGREDVRAEQLPAISVGDQLDQAPGDARRERPRDLIERQYRTLDPQPPFSRRRFGKPDRCPPADR